MNERQRAAQAALAADLDNEPESMTEAAQKIYAERRRKEERAKRKAEEKKQRIYRTLMRKAGITSRKKHLDHIKFYGRMGCRMVRSRTTSTKT